MDFSKTLKEDAEGAEDAEGRGVWDRSPGEAIRTASAAATASPSTALRAGRWLALVNEPTRS
jgi:hypothetical protein